MVCKFIPAWLSIPNKTQKRQLMREFFVKPKVIISIIYLIVFVSSTRRWTLWGWRTCSFATFVFPALRPGSGISMLFSNSWWHVIIHQSASSWKRTPAQNTVQGSGLTPLVFHIPTITWTWEWMIYSAKFQVAKTGTTKALDDRIGVQK